MLKNKVATLIGIIMLIIALFPNPYIYYEVQRFYICGLTAYLAIQHYQKINFKFIFIFGLIAIIFNPIIPIYLNKEIWSIIDIITIILLIFSLKNNELH
jgi:hypothetical protein